MPKYLDYDGLLEFKSLLDLTFEEKVDGKGLSTNDFTTDLKNKLDNIEAGATANEGTVTGVTINNVDYIPINGQITLPDYPTTLPASDVSSWAKLSTKPSYTLDEVTDGTNRKIPTKTSDLVNDSGFTTGSSNVSGISVNSTEYTPSLSGIITIPDYPTTLPASDVSSWAKESTKPSYDLDEVVDGSTRKIPTKVSDLTNDSGFLTSHQSLSGYATETWVSDKFDDVLGINASGIDALTTALSDNDAATGILKAIADKVDKESGKRLMTDAEGTKLSGIETGAQVHIAPTSAEVKSALGTGSGTTKYLREDGTWQTPPDNNTVTSINGKTGAIAAADMASVLTAAGYKLTDTDTNTTYSAGTGLSLSGTSFSLATSGVTAGTYKRVTVDSYGRVTSGDNTDADSWRTVQCNGTSIGNNTLNLKAGSNVSLSNSNGTITISSTDTNTNTWRGITDSYSGTDSATSLSLKGGNALYNALLNGYANSAGSSTYSNKVYGTYTGNGGQQGPSYYGKNYCGFLMSNQTVNGNTEYKNWLYMDCYSSNDVGGATAIGVNRMSARAYIMLSDANRTSWNNSAEIITTANIGGYGYITGITKAMVTNALGYTPPTTNTTYSGSSTVTLSGTTFSLTKANVTTALGYTPPTTNTTYSFSDKNVTLAWGTKSTIATVGGTDIHVTMPSNPNTNTTYSAGTGLSLSGTTFSLALTKALVTTALGYTPPTSDTNTWRPLGTGSSDACAGNDSRLSNSRPASDVYSWAKASSKPSYGYGEISHGVSSATTSGAISVAGTTPLHIITLNGNASSVALSSNPVAGHSCHIIFFSTAARTVTIAHNATARVCPGAADVTLNVPANGYAEVDFLYDGSKTWVRGV